MKSMTGCMLFLLLVLISCSLVDPSSRTTSLDIDIKSLTTPSKSGADEGTCECEDDLPPGAGFAFRREGIAMINLDVEKDVGQRKFFDNQRVIFKEVLLHGDGKTYPQIGQKALFRYTEFTSNECLSDPVESSSLLRTEDTDDSVSNAMEDLDVLIMKMSMGEKAMFFASLDLGCARVLQSWLQWWLEASCS
ncbi:hypothetical protein GUITHDRAFT_151289, partial [Guillardia theta CCMP2712]